MNWRDTKMRGPRPSMGRVNRGYDSNGPGSFGYGRSGTLNEGQNHYNSYTNHNHNPNPNTGGSSNMSSSEKCQHISSACPS